MPEPSSPAKASPRRARRPWRCRSFEKPTLRRLTHDRTVRSFFIDIAQIRDYGKKNRTERFGRHRIGTRIMESQALDQEVAARNDGSAKRRQIVDGARAVFLSAGFDGASMNDVARAAGVSKGTLYAYFSSKEEMFEAIIRGEYAQAAERLCVFKREGDVREMLTDFGIRLINRMTEPSHMALARVVVAAVEKFPNIGRAFFEAGPNFGATRLANELRTLERAGALNVP